MSAPQLPVWASDGTNNTAPITTQQKSGWTLGQDGVSSYDNWWKKLVYDWASRFYQRDVIDQLIAAVGSSTTEPEQAGNEVQTDFIYALTPTGGSAFLRQGTANNKLQIAPGILMQLRGGDIYAYRFDGTTEYTIANNADAVNSRVDIVQMKIDMVAGDNAPTVTISVKQGALALSPTYPAPDAGYCVVAGVVVGPSYAAAAGFKFDDTAGAVAVVHDQRMPLGVQAHRSQTGDFQCDKATEWIPTGSGANSGSTLQVSGSGKTAFVPILTGSYYGRVIGHDIAAYDGGTFSTSYIKRTLTDAGGGTGLNVTGPALNGGYTNGGGTLQFAVRFASLINIQNLHTPVAGPVVQANANGMGAPLWTNGRRTPMPKSSSFPAPLEMLGLLIVGNAGVQVAGVNYYVAGGL